MESVEDVAADPTNTSDGDNGKNGAMGDENVVSSKTSLYFEWSTTVKEVESFDLRVQSHKLQNHRLVIHEALPRGLMYLVAREKRSLNLILNWWQKKGNCWMWNIHGKLLMRRSWKGNSILLANQRKSAYVANSWKAWGSGLHFYLKIVVPWSGKYQVYYTSKLRVG